mgnify:CR=1 FL=1
MRWRHQSRCFLARDFGRDKGRGPWRPFGIGFIRHHEQLLARGILQRLQHIWDQHVRFWRNSYRMSVRIWAFHVQAQQQARARGWWCRERRNELGPICHARFFHTGTSNIMALAPRVNLERWWERRRAAWLKIKGRQCIAIRLFGASLSLSDWKLEWLGCWGQRPGREFDQCPDKVCSFCGFMTGCR